jgi:hypothetical protein
MIALSTITVVLSLAAPSVCSAQAPRGGRIQQQDTFASTNVLTPGAQDDWPLTARDDETIIISAASGAFDPAVELIASDGRVVAGNDDVREGEQDALLLARLATGGDYRVRVKSSSPTSGGQYGLTVRRFVATDLPIGSRTTGTLGRSLAHWHRFPAEVDQTLVLTARAASFGPLIQVHAPNGEQVPVDTAGAGQQNSTGAVFRAPQAGIYYVRISPAQGGDPRDSFAITAAVGRVFRTEIEDTNPARDLAAGGLDLWTFQGVAGDLVRVQAEAPAGGMIGQIAYIPPVDASGGPRKPEGPVPPLVILPCDPKSSGELVALLNLSGTYQVAVSQPLGGGIRYTLATSRAARPFAEDPESAGTLGLGGSDYWTIEGTSGQIVRLEGSSEQFDPELELYDPQGELISKNDDGASGRDALLTALLVARGRYHLRVHAHGDGGSGSYQLRRVTDPVRRLAIGAGGEGSVGAGGSEIWSFEGRAGQTVIISARSPDFNIRVALFGPDAAEVASDDDSGEGTDSLLSVRLPIDGTHTVWVTAAGGSGQYSLQLIEVR